jgi:hypothetical protein
VAQHSNLPVLPVVRALPEADVAQVTTALEQQPAEVEVVQAQWVQMELANKAALVVQA